MINRSHGLGGRSGAVLFECLLALALLIAAMTTIFALLDSASSSVGRRHESQEAAEIAATAISLIECGFATPETLVGPASKWRGCQDYFQWNITIETQPTSMGELVSVVIHITRAGAADDAPPSASLQRYLSLRPIARATPVLPNLVSEWAVHTHSPGAFAHPPLPTIARDRRQFRLPRKGRRRKARLDTCGTSWRRYGAGSRPGSEVLGASRRGERGFSLLELMIAIMLIGAVLFASFAMYDTIVRTRAKLSERSLRLDQRQALVSAMDRALMSACASDGVVDFVGTADQVTIPTRAQNAASPAGLTSRFTLKFDAGRGELLAAWDDNPPSPILTGLAAFSILYFEDRTFVERYDARESGGLPQAIEVTGRFADSGLVEHNDLQIVLSVPDSAAPNPAGAGPTDSPSSRSPPTKALSPRSRRRLRPDSRSKSKLAPAQLWTRRGSTLLVVAALIVIAALTLATLSARLGNSSVAATLAMRDSQLRSSARSALKVLQHAADEQHDLLMNGDDFQLPEPITLEDGISLRFEPLELSEPGSTFDSVDGRSPEDEASSVATRGTSRAVGQSAKSLSALLNINSATPEQFEALFSAVTSGRAQSAEAVDESDVIAASTSPIPQPAAKSSGLAAALNPARHRPLNGYLIPQDCKLLGHVTLQPLRQYITTHSWDPLVFRGRDGDSKFHPRLIVGSGPTTENQATIKLLDKSVADLVSPLLDSQFQGKSWSELIPQLGPRLGGLSPATLCATLDAITDSDAAEREGVIDVLRAPAPVLTAALGISPAAAERIVTTRSSLSSSARESTAFLLESRIITAEKLIAISPQITTRSLQWGVRIIASLPGGGGQSIGSFSDSRTSATDRPRNGPEIRQASPGTSRRSLALFAFIDASETPARIVALHEVPFDHLTPYGTLLAGTHRTNLTEANPAVDAEIDATSPDEESATEEKDESAPPLRTAPQRPELESRHDSLAPPSEANGELRQRPRLGGKWGRYRAPNSSHASDPGSRETLYSHPQIFRPDSPRESP